MSAEVALPTPDAYKLSCDLTEGLYLGEAVRLIEVPPLVDDEDAF